VRVSQPNENLDLTTPSLEFFGLRPLIKEYGSSDIAWKRKLTKVGPFGEFTKSGNFYVSDDECFCTGDGSICQLNHGRIPGEILQVMFHRGAMAVSPKNQFPNDLQDLRAQ
jgi:hypothetical protein